MPSAKMNLLLVLGVVAVAFSLFWCIKIIRAGAWKWPTPIQMAIGFITDFLDTLGVGSFATTTSMYRLTKQVDDALIPGTLNVGHALPTILQALIYTNSIDVDITTLVVLILSSVLGASLGASFVVRFPKRKVQLGMGLALLAAAALILSSQMKWLPEGGEATKLTGARLVIALVGNFVFGALMTIGIGAYAPIMIMVCLLGMNQKTAFPIMMGSCAFLMPISSYKFISSGKYDVQAALGLTLLGLPGVAVAAWIVIEMPTHVIQWLVLAVVTYTGLSLLRSSLSKAEPIATESVPSEK